MSTGKLIDLLNRYNEDDLIELFDSGLKFDQLSNEEQDQILSFFTSSKSFKLLDAIALFLSDSIQDKSLNAIIEVVKRLRGSKHSSTLIFACSEFDCTKYVDLFIDIMIMEDDHSTLEAAGVIEEMKGPISDEVYNEIKNKITYFIDNNRNSVKRDILEESLRKLSRLKD